MKRLAVATLAVMVFGLPARAQDSVNYRNKREQLMHELEQTQHELNDIRTQRVTMQTRIESVIAQMMEQRAQALLLSNETNALQQLDAILTSSQDNLLAQRDRFLTVGDAVRKRAGAILVVLLRADSSQAQSLESATVTIDNAVGETRTYSPTANGALALGAVDQLYRSNVLATSHTVSIQVSVNGQPVTDRITVTAVGDGVTYVQFAVRNGRIVQRTWTSKGTTPF